MTVTIPIPGEVLGDDSSYWNGPLVDPDLARSRKDLSLFRLSIGSKGVDATGIANTEAMLDRDGFVGPYHYCKIWHDWRKQAKNLVGTIRASIGYENVRLGQWLDCEDRTLATKVKRESTYFKTINEIEQISGYPCGIYSSPGHWNGWVPRTDWAKKHPWWLAGWLYAYNYLRSPALSAFPQLPHDIAKYPELVKFWQYEGKNNRRGKSFGYRGASPFTKDLDINRAMHDGHAATLDEFYSDWKLGQPPELPDPPPDDPQPPGNGIRLAEIVAARSLWMHSAPEVSIVSRSGHKITGRYVNVYGDTVLDGSGRVWANVGPEGRPDWMCVREGSVQYLRWVE